MSSNSSLAVVERAFLVIEALVGETSGVSVTELVNRTNLSKSMVSRILTTLSERKYVERDAKTRYYKLSLHFMSIAYRHINSLGLNDVFYPLMERTAQRTGELIQLAVVKEDGIFYVGKIEGIHPLKVASMLGQKAPYHATGAGKVWLASLTNQEVMNVIDKAGLKAYTAKTITDREQLLKDLQEVKKKGFALADEEINEAVVAVAVPIYDHREKTKVVAALVIAAPHYKMTEERIAELVRVCKEEIGSFDTSLLYPFSLGYLSQKLEQQFTPVH